jgi:hypothetical protein
MTVTTQKDSTAWCRSNLDYKMHGACGQLQAHTFKELSALITYTYLQRYTNASKLLIISLFPRPIPQIIDPYSCN